MRLYVKGGVFVRIDHNDGVGASYFTRVLCLGAPGAVLSRSLPRLCPSGVSGVASARLRAITFLLLRNASCGWRAGHFSCVSGTAALLFAVL